MEKIKLTITNFIESEKGKDIMIVIIVVLVGLGSFELGRLSKENSSSGLKIEYRDQGASVLSSIKPNLEKLNNSQISQNSNIQPKTAFNNSVKNFFASNRGSKYYSINCSAGKTIKIENRIYFTTGEDAERAGYTLSSACQ